jgi:hypothetical protein
VEYVQGGPELRVPYNAPSIGNSPFEFATCEQEDRIQISIDDSSIGLAHSLVYFSSVTQEFVFLGGQNPDRGTYRIKVSASIKAETKYICSSFEFDLVVLLEGEQSAIDTVEETEEPLCLQD